MYASEKDHREYLINYSNPTFCGNKCRNIMKVVNFLVQNQPEDDKKN